MTLEARKALEAYPALLVTGPRQSGKTTFVRGVFERELQYPYVNFESPLERAEFRLDPIGFLDRFQGGAIFDEVQHVPELLSFLQVRIDEEQRLGRWILTGSQQPELMRGAGQSLAGRIAVLQLLPFSHDELSPSPRCSTSLDRALLWGGYPPLYDDRRELEPSGWHENYLATFVHRDLRAVLEPRSSQAFDRFLRVCASRTGQELNKSRLAAECEVDQKTIGQWLSALETCYVIGLLPPYHKNFGKRLVKRPKLYFLDSGLACRLLHITDVNQLSVHPLRGALFETWCYTEIVKYFAHRGRRESLWYWRSSDGIEVDFLLQRGKTLIPLEIKTGMTPSTQSVAGIGKLRDLSVRDDSVELGSGMVLYGGPERRRGSRVEFVPWGEIGDALEALE